MRNILAISILVLLFSSCQDVIEVDLNDAEPRLVIEANINISKDTDDASAMVKLTTTAPFFDETIPTVDDAIVEIRDESGNIFEFQPSGEGVYIGDVYPRANIDYTLTVRYKNESYTATTQLIPTVPLEYVIQKDDGGFLGDQIELKVYFKDPADQENFYYYIASSERGVRRDVFKDEFFDGNLMFGSYTDEDLAPGDWVQFDLYGITDKYYNYMFILLQQTGGGGAGPFETQPATVRGNIINETNPDNYPLGYFRISETSRLKYQVQ